MATSNQENTKPPTDEKWIVRDDTNKRVTEKPMTQAEAAERATKLTEQTGHTHAPKQILNG